MNWLINIGGGILFVKLVAGIVSYVENGFEVELNLPTWVIINYISAICVWVWICLKFIK